MTRLRSALLIAGLLSVITVAVLLSARPVSPHNAPTGWAYDPTCCSGPDCAPAPVGTVAAGPDGWQVRLEPGDHPLVAGAPLVETIPFGDPRVMVSGDALFHVCVSEYSQAILCLYVPEGEWGA